MHCVDARTGALCGHDEDDEHEDQDTEGDGAVNYRTAADIQSESDCRPIVEVQFHARW